MTEKISAEASTLFGALNIAAKELGVDSKTLEYSFDLSHFRNDANRNKPVDTVRILAWAKDPADFIGAEKAQEWIDRLLELLSIEAKTQYKIFAKQKAEIQIDSEKGGLLVGRKGVTLKAIQCIFEAAMQKSFADWQYRIEILGGKKEESRERRGKRDDRRGKKVKNTDVLEKKAKMLAEKVKKSGEDLIIKQILNSFERRVVHQVINEIEGVKTESFMDKGVKRLRIFPAE
ncbi:MAG: R3H domain-containing nucleic acid-binding protein [Myxococcota bacterium]|nr:R3H domain-containing nucleic acid-binding protein [Myxococcota bacterium]